MTILVSILIFAAVVTVIGAIIFVMGESLRSVTTRGRATAASATHRETAAATPPPFGGLPTLNDPVGPLGNLAPDADLSSNADSEREIYGE